MALNGLLCADVAIKKLLSHSLWLSVCAVRLLAMAAAMDADIQGSVDAAEASDEAAVSRGVSDAVIDSPRDNDVDNYCQESDSNKPLSEEHLDDERVVLCSSEAASSNTVTSLTCREAADDSRCEAESAQGQAQSSEHTAADEHDQSALESNTDSCVTDNVDDGPHETHSTTNDESNDDWLCVLGHGQLKMRACICICFFVLEITGLFFC